ncbi:MAG: hypothetical protein EP343_31700 [Deltaproteobacteria bacterium]|nr:MAG: hypothetical protein EP343_31700 [Deltaproteobacteria bacterium]
MPDPSQPSSIEQPASSSPSQDPSLWGCPADASLQPLSNDEARQRLLQGGELVGVEVEELDLRSQDVSAPVVIRESRIHRLLTEGATFREAVTLEHVTCVEAAVLSMRDTKAEQRQTTFHGDVAFLSSRWEGGLQCDYATFEGGCRLLGEHHNTVSLSYCQVGGVLQCSSSVFHGELQIIQSEMHNLTWLLEMDCHADVLLRRSTFYQKVNVRESLFRGALFINHATFHLRAGFNKVTCEGEVVFDSTEMIGEFSSKGSTYKGKLSFRSVIAHTRIALHNSTFEDAVLLSRLQLEGDWQTPGVTFGGRVTVDDARINGTIDGKGTVFQGGLLCRNAHLGTLENSVNWEDAVFSRDFDLEGTIVVHQLLCSGASFAGKTSLRGAILGDKEGVVSFERAIFHRRTNFSNVQMVARCQFQQSTFHQNVSFNRAIFERQAVFSDVTFVEKATFVDAHFAYKAFFTGATFQQVEFNGAEFEGAAAFSSDQVVTAKEDSQAATFHGEAHFEGTRFLKKALFQFVTFAEEASYKYAYFGEQVSFRYAKFQKDAVLTGVFCNLELDLRRMTVAQELHLKGANINRRVNLADASFAGISFYNMVTDLIAVTPQQIAGKLRGDRSTDPAPIELERTANEFLLLKKSFAYQGMHDEEDWAYWMFRRTSRQASSKESLAERKWGQLCKNGLERVFLDYGSSYGTHPLRITVLAFCLILFFGVFYWCVPDQIVLEGKEIVGGQRISLVQSIYFSTMAFTTMGFGDVHPDFHGWLKGIVALEALVGIITMTLFVGTYARKIVR